MLSLRDERRSARRDLHDALKVPVLYFAPGAAVGLPVGVRLHVSIQSQGAEGGGPGWADRVDVTPRIIFLASDTPARGGHVSVDAGEAYVIATPRAPDGEFIAVEVTRMSAAQIAGRWPGGQPVPE